MADGGGNSPGAQLFLRFFPPGWEARLYGRQGCLPLRTNPRKFAAKHYDTVVNGAELGGGSIRICLPEVQKSEFQEVLQIRPDMVKACFGYMLEPFNHGPPPLGGIALGFDGLIAIPCNTPSIRGVIAFPKTANGFDLMTEAPLIAEPKQLRELHI